MHAILHWLQLIGIGALAAVACVLYGWFVAPYLALWLLFTGLTTGAGM